MKKSFFLLLFLAGLVFSLSAQENPREIEAWITKSDRSMLFQKSSEKIPFSAQKRRGLPVVIDDSHIMQSVDGFGFALTGGSAELMMRMSPEARRNLIRELFARDEANIGVSYLRISIGSSDLNSFVFSYDDLKEGETDFDLKKFDLGQDKKDVIPVLKEILAVNPGVKILASPWSPPVWMKTSGKVKAGSLKPECYDVYSRYFVKYIQEMGKAGIKIDAITMQNEPLNANNTPSMRMSSAEQTEFLKKHLGPALQKAGLTTKVVLFDHNLDRPDYPLSILSDPDAAKYADGSGFHHYGGDFSAMTILHDTYPDKNLYFTEQMVVEKPGSTTIDIASQVKRLILGATRNWSKNVLLWNIAADPNNDPHTNDGGCSMCQGAVTLDGDKVGRNIAYYVVAHASKFVTPGSVRISSTQPGDISISMTNDEERSEVMRIAQVKNNTILPNVAFSTPEGKIVLIVANDSGNISSFRVQHNGLSATLRLDPGSVGTYVW
ncbi:MAG TPA: glycoside hydrolase family 30 beta sandwich domain-containing protein [Bacteroidales bacterium]|nr:glycoside hydrolase family 30 beta sandwich domain-containing protein [Bacteroidales bacterium]